MGTKNAKTMVAAFIDDLPVNREMVNELVRRWERIKNVPFSENCGYWQAKATGILGCRCSVVQVTYHVTLAALLGLAFLGVCDVLVARWTKARWFFLHVVANIVISILCFPDVYFLLTDPLTALAETRVNHWPTALVFSVHVYHMCFFRNLQWVDWLHHILMVVIGAPVLITGEVGPLMNFNNFFMCGVPGGIDYAMLFAVKHNWITPMQEKHYNAAINVWIRVPSLLWVACFGYIRFFIPMPSELPTYLVWIRAFLMLLASWNGLFFMERVVGNYHVCRYKARAQRRDAKQFQGKSGSEPSDEEVHELPSMMPGLGMRTSISKQDLQQMEKAFMKQDAHID